MREWGHPKIAGLANVIGICEYPRDEVAEVVSLDHICFSLFLGTVLCAQLLGEDELESLTLRFLCFPGVVRRSSYGELKSQMLLLIVIEKYG